LPIDNGLVEQLEALKAMTDSAVNKETFQGAMDERVASWN